MKLCRSILMMSLVAFFSLQLNGMPSSSVAFRWDCNDPYYCNVMYHLRDCVNFLKQNQKNSNLAGAFGFLVKSLDHEYSCVRDEAHLFGNALLPVMVSFLQFQELEMPEMKHAFGASYNYDSGNIHFYQEKLILFMHLNDYLAKNECSAEMICCTFLEIVSFDLKKAVGSVHKDLDGVLRALYIEMILVLEKLINQHGLVAYVCESSGKNLRLDTLKQMLEDGVESNYGEPLLQAKALEAMIKSDLLLPAYTGKCTRLLRSLADNSDSNVSMHALSALKLLGFSNQHDNNGIAHCTSALGHRTAACYKEDATVYRYPLKLMR